MESASVSTNGVVSVLRLWSTTFDDSQECRMRPLRTRNCEEKRGHAICLTEMTRRGDQTQNRNAENIGPTSTNPMVKQ